MKAISPSDTLVETTGIELEEAAGILGGGFFGQTGVEAKRANGRTIWTRKQEQVSGSSQRWPLALTLGMIPSSSNQTVPTKEKLDRTKAILAPV